jgi:alkylated DNA repair dioxygenase AlkB
MVIMIDLFNTQHTLQNLLRKDGEAIYYGKIMNEQEAHFYLERLMQDIEWKNDEVKIFGKQIITKRKVAWYADGGVSYTYSNSTKVGLSWTDELMKLKALVENITKENYNSCLLNLYHNGDEGMGYHSDDEKSIVKNSAIASISFGAERKFVLKHKTSSEMVTQLLANGSLLLMKGETQNHWLHALNKTKKVKTPRINLTFRKMIV